MMRKRKFREKICMAALIVPLVVSSCGARDNPDSVFGVEENDDTQQSAEQPQAESGDIGGLSGDGDEVTAVADYHYIEVEARVDPEGGHESYAINGEWLYVTDHIVDEERTREYGEEGVVLYDYGISRKRIDDGYQERNYIVTGVERSGHKPVLLADREGNCYLYWQLYDWREESTTYRLEKYGTDGGLLWSQDMGEEGLEGTGVQLEQGIVDREGRVILWDMGGGCAFRFGADGGLEETYRFGLETLDGVVAGAGGKIYGYCISGEEAVFTEWGGTGETYACPVKLSAVYDGDEEGIYLGTEQGMYAYSPEKGEARQLWSWSDEYLLLGDGRLEGAFRAGEAFTVLSGFTDKFWNGNKQYAIVARVTFEDSREYPGKQIVTLATDTVTDMTNTLVQMYNRQSREYLVEILPAQDGAALQAQLMRGGTTDLAEVGRIYVGDLARLGAFEDLDSYYESSQVAGKEDILGAVREACIVGGKNVAVIPGFNITTMRARGDFIKAEEWTVWKFLEMGADNRMLSSQSPGYALGIAMGVPYGERFIDYENKSCSFDGEEFRRLLESCGSWEEIIERDGGYQVDGSQGAGEWLFDYEWIRNKTGLIWRDRSDFAEVYNYEGGDYPSTLIGYPGWEGGVFHLEPYCVFAMPGKAGNKEGAWDFLEYLLSEELQEKLEPMLELFPARKDSFEAYLQEEYDGALTWDTLLPTEEHIRYIHEMADSAVVEVNGLAYSPIAAIVSEEADMYFTGDATLDETAEKIQRRVQLYLDEL